MNQKIAYEFSQINQEIEILNIFKTALKSRKLNEIEIRAAASALHSIYNGIEKILIFLSEFRNIKIPDKPD